MVAEFLLFCLLVEQLSNSSWRNESLHLENMFSKVHCIVLQHLKCSCGEVREIYTIKRVGVLKHDLEAEMEVYLTTLC